MNKERFFTVIAGIGGVIALIGTYLIGFYHGAKVEKEKLIKDIIAFQKQIAHYKREIIEKEQRIKELETKTKKIVNLTQKVTQAIDNIPSVKEEEEEKHVDQIFVLQSSEDEKKIKENFLLEESSTVAQKSSVMPIKKEFSLESKTENHLKDTSKEKIAPSIFWTIQLGAFLKYEQAKSFLDRLSKKIDLNYALFIRKEGKYYKVCLGKFSTKQQALRIFKLLKERKIDGFIKKVNIHK
ncbi:MAG TPA: SPOR domain-containing protein [Aquificae bacterium]|nr:SPOR domain-containing protein [Aquificota bacterium]